MLRWFRSRKGRRTLAPALPRAVPSLPPTPPLDAPRPPLQASAAELALVRENWNAHRRNTPELTAREFLRILEDRHRFFAEERREREIKLAKLHASIRPLP